MVRVTALRELHPDSVLLVNAARAIDYLDRFEISLPSDSRFTVDFLTLQVFEKGPAWVDWLLQIRNALVKPFGLRTGALPRSRSDTDACLNRGDKAGPFTVSHRVTDEIVMAEGDRHLDFRTSVQLRHSSQSEVVVAVSTAVWYNNVWGRLYFCVIRPFHRAIVAATLRDVHTRVLREMRECTSAPVATPRTTAATVIGLVGSVLVTWTGLQHFPMAYDVAHSEPFRQLPAAASDFFILLCLCVGLLLGFVGLLSVYFSLRLRSGRALGQFYWAMTILFFARTVLEVMHPVTLIATKPPVLVFVALLGLVFCAAAVLANRAAVAQTKHGICDEHEHGLPN